MKNRALLLFLFLFSSFANADSIKIEDLELKRAIGMIYEEFLNRPYMLDPNVLVLDKKVSFYLTDNVDKQEFFNRYFENMNIKISKKNGVDYLKYVEPVIKIKGYSFVYKPKYRGVEYLSNNI
jgi:putative phage-related secreted protein